MLFSGFSWSAGWSQPVYLWQWSQFGFCCLSGDFSHPKMAHIQPQRKPFCYILLVTWPVLGDEQIHQRLCWDHIVVAISLLATKRFIPPEMASHSHVLLSHRFLTKIAIFWEWLAIWLSLRCTSLLVVCSNFWWALQNRWLWDKLSTLKFNLNAADSKRKHTPKNPLAPSEILATCQPQRCAYRCPSISTIPFQHLSTIF